MKENEPLETNMRPQPKNDNQKTIRTSYIQKEYVAQPWKLRTFIVRLKNLGFEIASRERSVSN